MAKPSPKAFLTIRASRGEVTIPWQPALCANEAMRRTWSDNAPGDSDFLHVFVVQAGQDGDGQKVHTSCSGFSGRAQHGRAAAGVDGKHIDA